MKRFFRTCVAIAALTLSSIAGAEDRILWYSVADGLENQTNLQNAINFAQTNHFNAICVLARYRANAAYIPNRDFNTYANPEPRRSATYDMLQYAIDRGHEAGLKVYAAYGCFLVSDTNTYPSFLPSGSINYFYQGDSATYAPAAGFPRPMLSSDLNRNEGVWADPGRVDVRDYTRRILNDIVKNYDIDGVILDRIRYPGDDAPRGLGAFGYNPVALNNMGLTNPAPGAANFITARRDAITNFISASRSDVHAMKPWIIYGAAPIVYGTSMADTYNNVFQHFPSWNNAANNNHVSGFGILDMVAPQYYRTVASSNANLMNLVNADIDENNRMFHQATFMASPPTWPADVIAQGICDTRQKGMKGWGIFRYGTLQGSYFTTLQGTNTTPCGTNVISSPKPVIDYTLKVNWDNLPPNNITNLSGSATPGQVVLTWSTPPAAADGDVPVKYLVYRSTSTPVKEYYANLANKNFDVTGNTFTDNAGTGVPGGPLYYKVLPVDNYNKKGSSNQAGPYTAVAAVLDIIVESRAGGAGKRPAPAYLETGSFGDSTAKSTAAGLNASFGSRYNAGVGSTGTYQPAIATAGLYDVYVTIGSSTNHNANSNWRIYRPSITDVTGSVLLANSNAAVVNNWFRLNSTPVEFPAGASGAAGGVEFTNMTGNNVSGFRFNMDAVKFVYRGPAPSSVHEWSAY